MTLPNTIVRGAAEGPNLKSWERGSKCRGQTSLDEHHDAERKFPLSIWWFSRVPNEFL